MYYSLVLIIKFYIKNVLLYIEKYFILLKTFILE